MQTVCCPAMERAIQDGYVTWPITYTGDKQLRHLTPFIHSQREERTPVFKLNFCPWCCTDVRAVAHDVPSCKKVLLIAAQSAYDSDVVQTGMEDLIIGEGKEYADKEDWLESQMESWLARASGRED